MNVLIAIDSFKGSMTSMEAGLAAKEGVLKAMPGADVSVQPMADGGEGTVDALSYGHDQERVTVTVNGPLNEPVHANYAILDGTTAILEMSAAAGITLIPKASLNPYLTTTYGVGQMIKDALDRGCREFILGIGGSATNDGGAGMLRALGFQLLDSNGEEIPLGASGLSKLVKVSTDRADERLKNCNIRVVTDVDNPLTGVRGSSAVFGPQKCATPEMVHELDTWLTKFAEVTKVTLPEADPDYPGSGAAGGLGFALHTYLNAKLVPGVDLVISFTGLEEKVKEADILITGEGQLDHQTVMGKAPSGIAKLGLKYDIPVLAFAGSVTEDASYCNEHGITAFFPIVRGVTTLEDAMNTDHAKKNMTLAVEQAFRLLAGK